MATTAPREAPLVPLADYEADTLTKLFHHPLQKHPRPDALMYRGPDGWKTLSHGEVARRVEEVAAGLQELGIGSTPFLAFSLL